MPLTNDGTNDGIIDLTVKLNNTYRMNPCSKGRDCKTCDSRMDSIFCNLPDEAVSFLNKAKITNTYKRGQYVFYSDNFPAGLYCVSSGIIRLETEGHNGNGHIL